MMDHENPARLPTLVSSRQLIPLRPIGVPIIRMPGLSDAAASALSSALILIASDEGAAGRDTLAALLVTLLQDRGVPCTLVDINTKPGPARKSSAIYRPLPPFGPIPDFVREFGQILKESQATIVVNITPAANDHVWAAEGTLQGFIEQQKRPQLLFWATRSDRPQLRGLGKYHVDGGRAHSVVAAGGPLAQKVAATLRTMTDGSPSELVAVPELPRSVGDAFYGRGLPLEQALNEADVIDLAMMEANWQGFLDSLEAVLA